MVTEHEVKKKKNEKRQFTKIESGKRGYFFYFTVKKRRARYAVESFCNKNKMEELLLGTYSHFIIAVCKQNKQTIS